MILLLTIIVKKLSKVSPNFSIESYIISKKLMMNKNSNSGNKLVLKSYLGRKIYLLYKFFLNLMV